MAIHDGVYIVDPWPAIYVEDLDTLLIADLHLGIEGSLEKEGIYLPLDVSSMVIDHVKMMVENSEASNLILLGDVKHEFGFPNPREWIVVKRLLRWLRSRGITVKVVRGNHDNYLTAILKEMEVPIYQGRLIVEEFTFTHGHLPLRLEDAKETIFMGHEHPSLMISEEEGVTHKFKCFLSGPYLGKKLVVLPAANDLASGTVINLANPSGLLSPILRGCDFDLFKAYLIEPGRGVKPFPRLKFIMENE